MNSVSGLPDYHLSLADGMRWCLRAGDPEAARVVASVAAAMRLQPAPPLSPPRAGGIEGGRELLAVARGGKMPPGNLCGPGPVVCDLPPLLSDELLTIGMAHLALVVAREAQSRGGALVHGALAEFSLPVPPARGGDVPKGQGGRGILLAGPGTVGKTTASNRLSPPWRSLCDDAALVVRDAQGRYWAHPWPTWSRFYNGGPGGSWDVQRAVPLGAIFFLTQSPEDRAEPLPVTQATAMLMEAVQHVSRPMMRRLREGEVQALHRGQLAAVEALARTIPAYTLHISLTGAFWEEIERVLKNLPTGPQKTPGPIPDSRFARRASIESLLDDGALHVVYTGPSMNPTLAEPDLLEVRPYGTRPVRRGDVIYFSPPEGEQEVVHRVVRLNAAGVRTRGDNNSADDRYLLPMDDIIGQVVAAQRGSRRRRIAGGQRGVWVARTARLWRVANRGVSRLLRGAYQALSTSGVFRRLLPVGLRPRVFVFQTRQRPILKLLMGGRVIGQYDTRQDQWRIRRPFRLFVDEAALPAAAPYRAPRFREKDRKGFPERVGAGSDQGP